MNAAPVDRGALIAAAFFAMATPGLAQDLCTSVVNGEGIAIDPEAQAEIGDGPGLRERLLAWPGRKLSTMKGRAPACDNETLIAYLSLTVPTEDIDGYCLSELDAAGFILVPGVRNFRGRCKSTACEKVNTTKDGALDVAGTIATGVANKTLGVEGPGDESDEPSKGLMHSSGAAILTGTSGYIASNLGAIGTGMTTALSAPAVLAASAVTVVAVGGAVYLCRD